MTRFKTLAIAICAATLCTAVVNHASAKTLSIRIDKSNSNPLMAQPEFAIGAANYVAQRILTLKAEDKVSLSSFGARSNASNLLENTYVLDRKLRAKELASAIAEYIKTIPSDIEKGQRATNIVSLLEFGNGFDCANAGEVIVITDGIEASDYIEADELISGKKSLPGADVDLSGCSVFFYGLGAGLSGKDVKSVRTQWQRWMKQSGANFDHWIP